MKNKIRTITTVVLLMTTTAFSQDAAVKKAAQPAQNEILNSKIDFNIGSGARLNEMIVELNRNLIEKGVLKDGLNVIYVGKVYEIEVPNLKVKNVTVQTFLNVIPEMAPVVVSIVKGEGGGAPVIVIRSKNMMEEALIKNVTRVYQIHKSIEPTSLIKTIMMLWSQSDPDWRKNGTNFASFDKSRGVIIIKAPPARQEEVASLLKILHLKYTEAK